jgi:hypothetical protein
VQNNIFSASGGVPVVASDGTGTDVYFEQNDYWSSDPALTIIWSGSTYQNLDDWSAATGQELVYGNPSGLYVSPGLINPGGGGIVGNADRLATLKAYELQQNSPLANSGLDLSTLAQVWDPYNFANDAFLSRHFNSTPTDFYGNLLPAAGSNLFSVGANQVGTGT